MSHAGSSLKLTRFQPILVCATLQNGEPSSSANVLAIEETVAAPAIGLAVSGDGDDDPDSRRSSRRGSKKGKHGKKPKNEGNRRPTDNRLPSNPSGPLSPDILAAIAAAVRQAGVEDNGAAPAVELPPAVVTALNEASQQPAFALPGVEPPAALPPAPLGNEQPVLAPASPAAMEHHPAEPVQALPGNTAPYIADVYPEDPIGLDMPATGDPTLDLTMVISYLEQVRKNTGPLPLPHNIAKEIVRHQEEYHDSRKIQYTDNQANAPIRLSAVSDLSDKDLPLTPYTPSIATGGGSGGAGDAGGITSPPGDDPGSEASPVRNPGFAPGPFDDLNKKIGFGVAIVSGLIGAAGGFWISDKIITWLKKKKAAKEWQAKKAAAKAKAMRRKDSRRHVRDWTLAVDY